MGYSPCREGAIAGAHATRAQSWSAVHLAAAGTPTSEPAGGARETGSPDGVPRVDRIVVRATEEDSGPQVEEEEEEEQKKYVRGRKTSCATGN